jgi:hypothetical protein
MQHIYRRDDLMLMKQNTTRCNFCGYTKKQAVFVFAMPKLWHYNNKWHRLKLLSAEHCSGNDVSKLMHLPCLNYCGSNIIYITDREAITLLNHD